MTRFSLYWVRTRGQWEDGFVVAKTPRAAATFVRNEAMSPVPGWASAERIATLPEHLQDPSVAVSSEKDDPRTVDWASPTILKACEVKIVHAKSPRAFFHDGRLFTEGVLDYLREPYGSTGSPEVFKNRTLAVMVRPGRSLAFGSAEALRQRRKLRPRQLDDAYARFRKRPCERQRA